MWKGMGTRQDFHGEHAAHREAYALRFGPPRMVEVETLVVVKYIFLHTNIIKEMNGVWGFNVSAISMMCTYQVVVFEQTQRISSVFFYFDHP